MKKAVAFISMVLCMALVITGCGGTKTGKDGGTGNQGNTGGNKTTKKIQWIMPSNAEQLKGYQGLVDKFNKEKSYDMEVLGQATEIFFPSCRL